ncbi:winged helix-turn-helix domain-containing protein [Succinivibrio sp.]|uniref:winged helix-turn-helix domain-containing protein n=1 Tax=Succinivibrio sp. TaxID=2053619 RepID=UPI003869279C
MKLVTENPKISRKAIGEKLGISYKTVGRKISEMTNLSYVGRGSNGSWKVNK